MMKHPATLTILALSLCCGFAALAQDAPAAADATDDAATETQVSQMDPASSRAHEVALGRISQDLSHATMAQIQLIAYATAAAGLCEDLGLDEGKVYADLVQSSHDDLEDATEEDLQRHRDFTLIAFGVMTGLMLEEAAADEANFCANAVAAANDLGQDGYNVQISTAEPLPADN